MHVTFQMQGGLGTFPGLSGQVTLTSATLSADDDATLRRLVDECCFFEREAPARSHAIHDARSYKIEIESDGKRRHITLTEPVPEALQSLVRHLSSLAKKSRR